MMVIKQDDRNELDKAEKKANKSLKTDQPLSERNEVAAAAARTLRLNETARGLMKVVKDRGDQKDQ